MDASGATIQVYDSGVLLGSTLAETGLFNAKYLRHLVDAHQSGARDYSAPIWTILMFEAFLRNSMKGAPSASLVGGAA